MLRAVMGRSKGLSSRPKRVAYFLCFFFLFSFNISLSRKLIFYFSFCLFLLWRHCLEECKARSEEFTENSARKRVRPDIDEGSTKAQGLTRGGRLRIDRGRGSTGKGSTE